MRPAPQLNSGVRRTRSRGDRVQASTLHAFLAGNATGAALAADVAGAIVQTGPDVYRLRMADSLDEDVSVTSAHLARLCDAVLAGELSAEALATIAFGMIASDHFVWDADGLDGER